MDLPATDGGAEGRAPRQVRADVATLDFGALGLGGESKASLVLTNDSDTPASFCFVPDGTGGRVGPAWLTLGATHGVLPPRASLPIWVRI